MTKFFQAILSLFMAFLSAINIFSGPKEVIPNVSAEAFEYLEYPEEAIISPVAAGLTIISYISRADNDGDELYVNAQGYQDINGIIESPYFTVHVEGKRIPVYATTVFAGTTQSGALHSFCEIYVDPQKPISLGFQLNTHGFIMNTVTVFPKSANKQPTFVNTVLNDEITELGTYTFVFNSDDQEHAFTLFVRELVDEEKEIADLKAEHGESNVVVVEKGFHNSDAYYNFYGYNDTVFYLKRGAYLLAKHTYDINSDDDNYNNTSKIDTTEYNAGQIPIGLTRVPYLNYFYCNNIKLLGNGIVDLSHLDRGDRRGIVFSNCNNVEIDGLKFINAPEWTFIVYDCENVTIKNVDIFGYRQNSDAFAICNTRNATIDNSFCRSGDDLFDVKTLGGRDKAISQNITFSNCTAWNGKARCFGICGEVTKAIKDITFRDSSVIFHDATWDENRIPALAIIVENDGGSIDNVTFENIDIHRAYSRAIGCLIYTDTIENFSITNVKYKNIRYTAPKANKIASNGKVNTIQAEFENIYASGSKITSLNTTQFEYDSYANITVK